MDRKRLLSELQFKATRSSGPGGQHVNKTSTRVELNWHIHTSHAFSEEEKLRIKEKLSNRITKEVIRLESFSLMRNFSSSEKA